MNKVLAMCSIAAIAVGVICGCDNSAESVVSDTRVSADAAMNRETVKKLVWELEAEINNGGFDQFFFNSAGDSTQDTIRALEAIGARHTADIVRDAAAKFPNGMPSSDRLLRQDQLETVSPDSEAFESQDKAFYEYTDDLQALVEAYEG